MNHVSEISMLNEGRLQYFCDQNQSVPLIVSMSGEDSHVASGLNTLYRTQIICRFAHQSPAHVFLF